MEEASRIRKFFRFVKKELKSVHILEVVGTVFINKYLNTYIILIDFFLKNFLLKFSLAFSKINTDRFIKPQHILHIHIQILIIRLPIQNPKRDAQKRAVSGVFVRNSSFRQVRTRSNSVWPFNDDHPRIDTTRLLGALWSFFSCPLEELRQ